MPHFDYVLHFFREQIANAIDIVAFQDKVVRVTHCGAGDTEKEVAFLVPPAEYRRLIALDKANREPM